APDADRSKVRLTIAAEIGEGHSAAAQIACGYTIVDSAGAVIAAHASPARLGPAPGARGALEYRESLSLVPGDYTLKVAATDAGGRVGSVDRAVHVDLTHLGQLAMSDLVIADDRDAAAHGTQAHVVPEIVSGRLQFVLDVRTPDSGLPSGTRATFEIVD